MLFSLALESQWSIWAQGRLAARNPTNTGHFQNLETWEMQGGMPSVDLSMLSYPLCPADVKKCLTNVCPYSAFGRSLEIP